jgi:hypothetical protein
MARGVSPFSSASMAAPYQRTAFDFRSPGAAEMAWAIAFHLGGVRRSAHISAEDDHDSPSVEPGPSSGLECGLGVTSSRVEVESEHGRGGELKADDRTGAGRA